MVRAAMLNGGRLRRFNDYDFVGYSQKTEGPFQSTAVRSKKQAHLATIVALAAWAGRRAALRRGHAGGPRRRDPGLLGDAAGSPRRAAASACSPT